MQTLLPLIALLLLLFIVQVENKNWRGSLLSALVVWGVILTSITEFLSALKILNFAWVLVLWSIVNSILLIIFFRIHRKRGKSASNNIKLNIDELFKLPFASIILLSGIALIVIGVGVVAVMAAPNHSDSMEYHMSRVAHWIQNSSVVHYPTHTVFQLYQNPWSEFAITHLQILSGGDRFANLIQWGSMLSSIVGVSLIASQLGSNFRGQILASIVCATIPMGILQGSSTNNDYVISLWLVCFAHFTLLIIKDGAKITNISRLGASLGLAILTKGTAYIYAFPFCIWLSLWGIKNLGLRVWKPFITVLFIILAINFGHYTRNTILFGSPLGLSSAEINETFSLAIFISGVTRNLALHADIVRNLNLEKVITATTGLTEKLIQIIHFFLGLDVSDPRITSPKVAKFYVPALSLYEDTAGNPLHLLLIFVSSSILMVNKRLRKQPHLISYFAVILAGFCLFCFLFTWSPWRCRLHLPLFILFSALVGVVISKSLNYRITYFFAIILLLLSHSWVLSNSVRPLLGSDSIFNTTRIDHYFRTQKNLKAPYIETANIVKARACSNIGLTLEGTSFEYPFWRLLQQDDEKVIIRHVNVNNKSAVKVNQRPHSKFNPCVIIAVNRNEEQIEIGKNLITKNGIYSQFWSKNLPEGLVQIFIPKPGVQQ